MKTVAIETMTEDEIRQGLKDGGRCVYFIWCISILVMTFRRPTGIYFIPAGKSAVAKGLPYTIFTLFVGWWGIPWGPLYSLQVLGKNLTGGYDVTKSIAASLAELDESDLSYEATPEVDEALAAAAFVGEVRESVVNPIRRSTDRPVEKRNTAPVIRR